MEDLVNVAQNQTVLTGLHCVVSGDTVRPETSQTEIQMLGNVPLLQTVRSGLPFALNLDIARKMELEVEMAETQEKEEEVEMVHSQERELELEMEEGLSV